MKIIGTRIKTLREGIGISQMRLGKTFGIGQSSLANYELGKAGVPAELLVKYSDYFDMSMDYIFGRTDDPHGMYCKAEPKVEQNYSEMDKFIEMCFEPGLAMNERLKETLKQMMRGEAK